jgi:O-antigen ligase
MRLPSTAEKGFAVLVLLLSTGAFLNLGLDSNSDFEAGRTGMEMAWLLLYLGTITVFLKYCSRAKEVLKGELWLILLVTFALASVLWSDYPSFTARRAIALICTTLFGFYFALRYPLRQQLRLLSVAFTIAAVASVFFQLFGWGTNLAAEGVPGWIGVYFQKQQLGMNMAFAIAVLLTLIKSDPEYRSWARIGCVLSFALLVLSRSATAVVMFAALLLALPLRGLLRKRFRAVVLAGVLSLPLIAYSAVWCFQHLDAVTGLLGRDLTLTGRIPLWVLCTVMALQRPWLGYGYNAFWQGRGGDTVNHVVGWMPNSAHNGFLEIWLGLGMVGLGLFAITLLIYIKRAVTFVRTVRSAESIWPLLFLILLLLCNLSQATILIRNSIFWIMYVAVGLTSAQLPKMQSPANECGVVLQGKCR